MVELNKVAISTISIVLLVSLGFNMVSLTDSKYPVYYCESKNITQECARFSESGLRCYPNLEDTKGYKDCSEGWLGVVLPDTLTNTSNFDEIKAAYKITKDNNEGFEEYEIFEEYKDYSIPQKILVIDFRGKK